MAKARGSIVAGVVTALVGAGLKLFADDVHPPVFEPGKLGVVLLILGIAEVLYGVYRSAQGDRKA
ncbi:hypothetical protein B4N89_16200 [Embleya scabrispora]|uniref:Uncharacterized protein n=1 Tax=Embleya scabrispora TaxID=159449 RepID=A0A1T3NZK4_9ACTN|nr:DUF5708 family protein [Embleya scabrispora]OPC82268.1 hypothetical protein B4N89_16200 [Embleya scabrispora]